MLAEVTPHLIWAVFTRWKYERRKMDQILTWIATYSPLTALLLAIGAAALFVLQKTTEKAITSQFEKHSKEVELRLERVSRFREHILLESFKLVTDLESRLQDVNLGLARYVKGNRPEGFIKHNEVVPLSEISYLLSGQRFLLPPGFYDIFAAQKNLLLQMVEAINRKDEEALYELDEQFIKREDKFHEEMIRAFGLHHIYEPLVGGE
jgi:hypothetical protein